jgi:hypothetical protein
MARRRCWSLPRLASVINFSTNGLISLAFWMVVEIVSCSMSDWAMFRRIARRCAEFLLNWRPATL